MTRNAQARIGIPMMAHQTLSLFLGAALITAAKAREARIPVPFVLDLHPTREHQAAPNGHEPLNFIEPSACSLVLWCCLRIHHGRVTSFAWVHQR